MVHSLNLQVAGERIDDRRHRGRTRPPQPILDAHERQRGLVRLSLLLDRREPADETATR